MLEVANLAIQQGACFPLFFNLPFAIFCIIFFVVRRLCIMHKTPERTGNVKSFMKTGEAKYETQMAQRNDRGKLLYQVAIFKKIFLCTRG